MDRFFACAARSTNSGVVLALRLDRFDNRVFDYLGRCQMTVEQPKQSCEGSRRYKGPQSGFVE